MSSRFSVWWFVFIVLLFPPALEKAYSQALQFEFGGADNQWAYFQYGQRGALGFFGPYNIDASTPTPGTYSNLNGWVGNRPLDVAVLVSGSDAGVSSLALSTTPLIGNDWLKLTGRYNIQVYNAATAEGVFNTMSTGQLSTWAISASFPFAKATYGKRMFFNGLGLQFASSRSQEYLTMERQVMVPDLLARLVAKGVLPKGMLSWFNPQAWHRFGEAPSTEEAATGDAASASTACPADAAASGDAAEDEDAMKGSFAGAKSCDGWLSIGFGLLPWQRITNDGAAWARNDLNYVYSQNLVAYLKYSSNDLEASVGLTRATFHEGPELIQDVDQRVLTPTKERYITEGWAVLKWSNGRFFFNTELDWFNRILRFQRTATGFTFNPTGPAFPEFYDDGSGRSRFAPQYWESWRYMAEAGVLLGPSSGRIFYAFMPGPDRRHGILIDRQPFIQENAQCATDAFDPYSIIFSYLFGGGVDAPAHISAASVYAAKIDHALAANLILSGSVMHAVRNSHGYGWGYIRPSVQASMGVLADGAYGTVNYAPRGTFGSPSPAIPDNDLGWEYVGGITWQLLDTSFFGARVSYWKPGKWFSYACIDRSVPAWNTPTAANNWGCNPNRDIDGIYGFEIRLGATY